MQSIGLQRLLGNLENGSLEHGELSMVNLQERHTQDLFSAVDKNRTLRSLQLQDCQISDKSCTRIAKTLLDNITLTKLDLSNNQIGFNGALCLLNALNSAVKEAKDGSGKGPALQQLLLDGNKVPVEVINDITDTLEAHSLSQTISEAKGRDRERDREAKDWDRDIDPQWSAPGHSGVNYDTLRAKYDSNQQRERGSGRPESRGGGGSRSRSSSRSGRRERERERDRRSQSPNGSGSCGSCGGGGGCGSGYSSGHEYEARPKSRSRSDRPLSSRRNRGRDHKDDGAKAHKKSKSKSKSKSSKGSSSISSSNPWEGDSSLEGENWEAVASVKHKAEQIGDEREALLEKLRLIEEAKGLLEEGGTETSMRRILSDIEGKRDRDRSVACR